MGKVVMDENQEFPEMETDDFTDSQLIYHVRDALASVTSVDGGDRENYDELVGYLHPKKYLNPDEIALLVTTLKALAGAASYIDSAYHEALLFAVSRMSLWNYGTDVMDALLELIISLAASNGKYIDWCLEMLVKNFVPPYFDILKHENGIDKKNKVLSRVHAALKDIADLVPLAPLRLSPIVVQRMPSVFSKEPEIVAYVENMLRLESGAIGEIVSGTMLPALVDRLIELDVEIGWDGLLQEDAKGMFEMELEDDADIEYNDAKYDTLWLQQRHKKSLLEALEKIKAELMILGFISLLLTFGQRYIVKICIRADVADILLPCPYNDIDNESSSEDKHRRKLLSYEHRYLSEDTTSSQCKEGEVPLLSVNGLHQLHILLFFLAITHVLYSAVTMLLGRLKIRGWKAWEEETSSSGFKSANDSSRFQFPHDTPFVRAHATFWARYSIFFYIGCFFRQFYRSVHKADYVTLRNGFITVHLAPRSKFNFQKYIKRSLEDDFKLVVGISPVLWASFVVFLLLNVNGWHAMYWTSIIPLVITLVVGTKLQATLANMAIEITERHTVVQGMPLVQGSDRYFWFGRPQLVLHLIHFALFQNAIQITHSLWIQYSFGPESCFHAGYKLAILKVALGAVVLCLCSYITLPLYALVTQMGSTMKKSIFDEHTAKALEKWRMDAKKKKRLKLGNSNARTANGSTNSSTMHSSRSMLHRFKTMGHSTRTISPYDDQDDYHGDQEA